MKKIFGLFVGVAALSAVLALGSPMLVFTETVYADEVNMDDFVMDENGVLTKYKGNSEKVVVPEGVTSIGDYAFYGCSGLTSIEVPEGVTSIGDYAFYGCSGLTSIEVPEGVTSIGASAFFHCFRLTSIELPERITNIGNSAFYGCSGLTSIELPEGVISIGDGAFSKCSGLTSINISPENGVYASYDGCLYNKDLTTLIVCPSGESRVKLPEGVTSIGDSAFADCSGLTSIELPEGVTSIGD
ncbi:MAG: leucine-rich repeat domain-containing protein, partial [Lachnospiraceae bacterium]|nr:leucine-rich repeat domain-containing protein [Lachnospiraceae bacterium]